MKRNTFKLLLIAFVFVAALSSCATKKKYGCPEHISIERLLGL